MSPQKKHKSTPPESGADRISALPDSILHHLLSFLPAQAAVQTCVLSRRWRHLWRSTTSLRIVALDDEEEFNVQDLRQFVDHLLILRERTDLDTVEIKFDEFLTEDQSYVNLWIRFAVMCKVHVLTLQFDGSRYLYLYDLPLVSRHLRTLDLGVAIQKAFLDFSSCPALEILKMNICGINAGKISSHSLKHLSLTGCRFKFDCRIRICTPGLVSLELGEFMGRTPFLESMALLETAYVDLGEDCEDACLSYDSGVFCGAINNTCENCVPNKDDGSSNCVLLGGISSAKHLKLLSESRKGPNHEVEMKGRYIPMEPEGPSAVSKHLNIVEVKCNVVDKRILKVLKFLSAFNICFSF